MQIPKSATIKTERICSHIIEYWFENDDNRELNECDIEHIQKLLLENYVEGELCQYDSEEEIEYYGWWQIRRD